MKRTIIFKDAENNKVVFNAELKIRKDDNLVFSASGEYCGSLGQCFDHVKTRTEAQRQLIDLWNVYHLNDMHAGTIAQEQALKESGYNFDEYTEHGHKSRYDFQCHVLDIAGLLTDNGYKYGSSWLYRSLPENFEDTLNELMDQIEEEEENEKDRFVNSDDIELFNDFDNPGCALALALMFGLAINEIEDIQENGDNWWTVQGIDYVAGTDEEMDEKWDEELECYIEECILPDVPDNVRKYFDNEAWKRDARSDDRGHALNRYDGEEEKQTVNGTTYYAYRQ